MKRKIIVLISFLILFSVAQFSHAATQSQPPGNLQEAISLANQEIGWEYFTLKNKIDKALRLDNLTELGYVLVYGEVHGDKKGNESRYLGYTWNDEDYTNPIFPHDAWGGGVLEDRNWIMEPWNNVQGAIANSFDGNSKYLTNIQAGLKQYYADVIQGEGSQYWNKWHQYVHILQPPTYWTWGMGRMWHQVNGSVWYITVPLAPTVKTISTPQPPPQQSSTDIYTIDGCFLDMPKQEGNIFSTYIIRAPRIMGTNAKLYIIDEPIKARIRVYKYGPSDYTGGTDIDSVSPKYLLFDDEITFTKDNPVWVKKFSFPAPSNVGDTYGLFVQTEGGASNGISRGNGVRSCATKTTNSFTLMSHTTSDSGFFKECIPWDFVKSKYNISPLPTLTPN